MAAVRDSICNFGQFQIPRPKCVGMEFVTIRGTRSGFYRTINKTVALKYGLVQQRNGGMSSSRRPTIPENWIGENGGGKEGSIAEEPEMEPTPDYEMEEGGGGRGTMDEEKRIEKGRKEGGKSTDRIAIPNGHAPPAPPLRPELRRSLLLQKNRPSQNSMIPISGEEGEGKKNQFDLMAAEGHKFMGTFRPAEMLENNGRGGIGNGPLLNSSRL